MGQSSWFETKDSKEKMLENLKFSCSFVLDNLKENFEIKERINLNLATLEQLYQLHNTGFVPPIAERAETFIVFYQEILKEVINKINDVNEIETFVRSVCMHELVHICLKHKSNPEKQRSDAEIEVNSWMEKNRSYFQNSFSKYMPVVNSICETKKKR